MPYDAWSERLFGVRINDLLGLERNHFDRLVHFSYGLLMAYPMREMFLRVADARGFWGYFLPLDLTLSTSAIFELFEWRRPSCSAAISASPISARRATHGTPRRTWRSPGWGH